MSKYKYSLYGYHAIEKADITINGITVLSGENGCAKVLCQDGCII